MTEALVRELNSTDCRCGAAKKAGNTFCAHCYYRLTRPMRSALYKPVGGGYEEAYATAVGWLVRMETVYGR